MKDDPGIIFENEVRRVAKELWPSAINGGSIVVQDQERDGIFVTEECVHILEVTISTKKDKATKDCDKIKNIMPILKKKFQDKPIQGWFVTQSEPTADQRAVADRNGINAVSLMTFKGKLVDSARYLTCRENYPFGSVRDPENDSITDSKNYISIDFLDIDKKLHSLNDLSESLQKGSHFLITGEFGIGKSTTLKELFFLLRKKYHKGKSSLFPIMLNLRDHSGQTNTAEAIERHARNIGYKSPSQLVRAWRAGYVILLLDGFDELGRSGVIEKTKKLKNIRYEAMELIRNFIDETPNDSGVALTGRNNFFDSDKEMYTGLGVKKNTIHILLNEFNEEQMNKYLENFGYKEKVPSWFPSKPLLLGYLASRGHLSDISKEMTPAFGWNLLLDKIAEREAKIDIGVDGETIRKIIERLASESRNTLDGLGKISFDVMQKAFNDIVGYYPDEQGIKFLQRLAPLGVTDSTDGTRMFINSDLLDAACAGEVFRYIVNPYENVPYTDKWQYSIKDIGVDVVILQISNNNIEPKLISHALERAGEFAVSGNLAFDILNILLSLNYDYRGKAINLCNIVINELILDEEMSNLSSVIFKDCLFESLYINYTEKNSRTPFFSECYFDNIIGRASAKDMGERFDDNCEYNNFEKLHTTSSITNSSLSLNLKVAVILLRKLFLQPGRGRIISALTRGLDHNYQRIIPEILHLFLQENIISKNPSTTEEVWLPNRKYSERVKKFILSPNSADPILKNKIEDI